MDDSKRAAGEYSPLLFTIRFHDSTIRFYEYSMVGSKSICMLKILLDYSIYTNCRTLPG